MGKKTSTHRVRAFRERKRAKAPRKVAKSTLERSREYRARKRALKIQHNLPTTSHSLDASTPLFSEDTVHNYKLEIGLVKVEQQENSHEPLYGILAKAEDIQDNNKPLVATEDLDKVDALDIKRETSPEPLSGDLAESEEIHEHNPLTATEDFEKIYLMDPQVIKRETSPEPWTGASVKLEEIHDLNPLIATEDFKVIDIKNIKQEPSTGVPAKVDDMHNNNPLIHTEDFNDYNIKDTQVIQRETLQGPQLDDSPRTKTLKQTSKNLKMSQRKRIRSLQRCNHRLQREIVNLSGELREMKLKILKMRRIGWEKK